LWGNGLDRTGSGMWGYGLDRTGSGLRQVAGTCKCGNEPFGFDKMWGISCLTENRLAPQEGLCSRE
jgi:hypothetical protein